MELTARPAGIPTWVEPLPAQDPAVRHLWERVATLNDFHDPRLTLDATIAALVAAGALEPDAPVIDEARAVLAVLRPGSADPAARPAGLAETDAIRSDGRGEHRCGSAPARSSEDVGRGYRERATVRVDDLVAGADAVSQVLALRGQACGLADEGGLDARSIDAFPPLALSD